jgi:hypothetical protein
VWKHNRELLRPALAKPQIEDPKHFEKHIQNLLKYVPQHGQVFNLQAIFFTLTMDLEESYFWGEFRYFDKWKCEMCLMRILIERKQG